MKKLKCQNQYFTTQRDGMHLTVSKVASMGRCSYYASLQVAEYSAAPGRGGAGGAKRVCPESTRMDASKKA